MQVSLHRAQLTYGKGLLLHTAASGPVRALDALYLRIVGNGIEAVGETRLNVAYLNGLAADQLIREALDLLTEFDLAAAIDAGTVAVPLAAASAPLRMMVDIALHDWAAKRRAVPLASLLARGPAAEPVRSQTNQTLFISDEATFLGRAEAYVARGFRDLKVRIGAGNFADDLKRLRLLRTRFGDAVDLAADANGAWELEQARANLAELAPLDLLYVEQPVAPGPLEPIARLAEGSPVPIMLDESLGSVDDAAALACSGHPLMAHLKLIKLGGLAPTLSAARVLSAAGIPVMIGQMNEGGVATAAALHLAAAIRPRFAELYGADGLADDPAAGLVYEDGRVEVPAGPGLGISFDAQQTQTLWEDMR